MEEGLEFQKGEDKAEWVEIFVNIIDYSSYEFLNSYLMVEIKIRV